MLVVSDLESGYGGSQVLFGASVDVGQAEIVSILGRNGVGKTTLLQTIMGYLRPWAGCVRFEGEDVTRLRTEDRFARGIGYVPQEHNVFGSLSVRENLEIGAGRRREKAEATEEVLTLFPRLGERLRQRAGSLSGGERKMLAIARALLGDPRMLLLDEPTEGVWPGVVVEIEDRLHLLGQSRSIVIVEQHVEMALRLSERTYVFERGKVVLAGHSAEIANDPALYRYLAL